MRRRALPFLVSCLALACAHAPLPLAGELETRHFETAGPFAVGTLDVEFVDQSRATAANGDFAGAAARSLKTTVWYPADAPGARPLVVYAHGFMSWSGECQYLARHLASHGYVVAAADFPLTNLSAPGGSTLDDVVNQPRDVSFLISELLRESARGAALRGRIDAERIAAVGLSLGAFTVIQSAFHRRLRDPRIKAVVAIAGPTEMLTPTFFEAADVPALFVYGDIDRIISYRKNGRPLLGKVRCARLVTLEGASHTAFADIASLLMWWLPNPDSLGCAAMTRRLPGDDHNPFAPLGEDGDGFFRPEQPTVPCTAKTLPRALRPRRQHDLTRTAVFAFLTAQLDPERRAAAERYLAQRLQRENAEASYETSCPAPAR